MTRMATIVLFLVIFIRIKGHSTELAACGQLGPIVMPLIADSYETHHHWPWHAAIYHRNNESNPIYQCGGTLISSKSVLTAAHCVTIDNMQLDTNIIVVSLGRQNIAVTEKSNQTFEIAAISVHPDFNSIDFVNDIAIIRLSGVAEFNNYVQPCCLWMANRTDISEVIGKNGTIVGWGLTEEDRIASVLRQVSSQVVSWGTCLESKREVFSRLLSERNFCAGLRNGTGVCQGDSGGSMTFEINGIYYIRGIVSFVPSMETQTADKIVHIRCDPSQYAIFTDVAYYLPWISNTTANFWISERATTITDCVSKVECRNISFHLSRCFIRVHHSNQKCKIIFDEVLYADSVKELCVEGEYDVIPDVTNASAKFENLERLLLGNAGLKIVERFILVAFKGLKVLNLGTNAITHLDSDTFDDLKNLETLELNGNNLKHVHPDLFKELTSLKKIFLNSNQLEILPRGLFRNNKELTHIDLQNNKVRKIEFIFDNMQNLVEVDLRRNVCINTACNVNSRCSSFLEMNEQVRSSCSY